MTVSISSDSLQITWLLRLLNLHKDKRSRGLRSATVRAVSSMDGFSYGSLVRGYVKTVTTTHFNRIAPFV